MLRYDRLKQQGIEVFNPVDLLQHLPKVEPVAVGTVFRPLYLEGHFELAPELTWDDLPEFQWSDIYAQVAGGLNDPSWAGWSQKNQNKWKKEKIDAAAAELQEFDAAKDAQMEIARKAVEEYEERHNLPKGTILQNVAKGNASGGWLTLDAFALPDGQSPGGESATSGGLGSLWSC